MTFEGGNTDDTGVEDGEKIVDQPARTGADKPLRDHSAVGRRPPHPASTGLRH